MNKAKFKEGDLVVYTFIGDPTDYQGIIKSVVFRTHQDAWYYEIVDVRRDRVQPVTRHESRVMLQRGLDLTELLSI